MTAPEAPVGGLVDLALIAELCEAEPGLRDVRVLVDAFAADWSRTVGREEVCVFAVAWEETLVAVVRTFVGTDRSARRVGDGELEAVLREPVAFAVVREWVLSRLPRCVVRGCWCPLVVR